MKEKKQSTKERKKLRNQKGRYEKNTMKKETKQGRNKERIKQRNK